MIDDGTPLGVARSWLRQRVDDGERCPLCTQRAQVYRRRINAAMARALVEIYRLGGTATFIHTAAVIKSHEVAQLSWWDLITEADERRDDGGRAGWWAVTRHGEDWIHGRVSVPRFARVYDGRRLGLIGPPTTIGDALGSPFDLRDVLAHV